MDKIFTPSIFSDTDHLGIAPLLLALTQSYALLMTGLSRTTPHPSLPAAYRAQRNLLHHLDAITADVLGDADMSGPLLAARQAVLDKHEIGTRTRSADLLALVWNLNSPHLLAFWLLLHLIADETLLSRVRRETEKYVKAVQEPPVMGFTVPPRVTMDAEGIVKRCPLLKSAFIETVRLYSRGLYSRKITENLVIEAKNEKVFKRGDRWAMAKGEFIDVPFWLANTDPATFSNPEEWDADRHLATDEAGKEVAKWGNVLPNCRFILLRTMVRGLC
jgi:cytochrome P450